MIAVDTINRFGKTSRKAMNGDLDQVRIYRKLAPWQRLAGACELYWFAREIIKNRIRRANPGLTKAELEKKVRACF